MSIKSVRLRIEGRVQGIWYRGWTVDQARALNIEAGSETRPMAVW